MSSSLFCLSCINCFFLSYSSSSPSWLKSYLLPRLPLSEAWRVLKRVFLNWFFSGDYCASFAYVSARLLLFASERSTCEARDIYKLTDTLFYGDNPTKISLTPSSCTAAASSSSGAFNAWGSAVFACIKIGWECDCETLDFYIPICCFLSSKMARI
jgi:hypothetical protein